MVAVLAARQHWCRPGERILWLREHRALYSKYDVSGLDENGNPQRGIMSRALRATALGVVGAVAAIDYYTSDDTSWDDGASGGESSPRTWVFGEAPECLAASAARQWLKRTTAGWEDVPGWWVLTPARFAWLTTTEAIKKLDKGEKSLVGNVASLAGNIAVGLATLAVAEYPAGKPVEFPEVVSGFEFNRSQITGVQPVLRDNKVPVLRLALVDGSGFDFELRGRTDPMPHFTNGG